MAKVPAKKVAAKAPKKVKAAAPAKAKKSTSVAIDKVIPQVLDTLIKLDAEHQLQGEIKWCLGSYQYDRNPKGLFETGEKAVKFFAEAKAKKVKGIPAKLVTDLQKALKKA